MKNQLTVTFSLAISIILMQGCSILDYDPLAEFQQNGIGIAAYEMGCAKRDLDVVSLGGSSYGVIGCGKKATYVGPGESGFVRTSEIEVIK